MTQPAGPACGWWAFFQSGLVDDVIYLFQNRAFRHANDTAISMNILGIDDTARREIMAFQPESCRIFAAADGDTVAGKQQGSIDYREYNNGFDHAHSLGAMKVRQAKYTLSQPNECRVIL